MSAAAAALMLAAGVGALAPAQDPSAVGSPVACRDDAVTIRRHDASLVAVAVEVADTPEARARGLMFRDRLARDHGMLFIYEAPQPVAFWMKNTLIPLDMLFIDAAGQVRRVHEGAIPHDETPIPGDAPGDPAPDRLMVLELAAGEAARLGLVEGSTVAHPRLDPELAALPCE